MWKKFWGYEMIIAGSNGASCIILLSDNKIFYSRGHFQHFTLTSAKISWHYFTATVPILGQEKEMVLKVRVSPMPKEFVSAVMNIFYIRGRWTFMGNWLVRPKQVLWELTPHWVATASAQLQSNPFLYKVCIEKTGNWISTFVVKKRRRICK